MYCVVKDPTSFVFAFPYKWGLGDEMIRVYQYKCKEQNLDNGIFSLAKNDAL